MEDLLKPTIILKSHPAKLLTRPAVLQPLMTLAREHLPLSFLDLASPTGDLDPSRLYESHVRVLDLESRRGSVPQLLIARLDATCSLFAVERHDKDLYAVCKLGDWVDLSRLAEKATIACRQLLLQTSGRAKHEKSGPMTTPTLHKAQSRKRLAIEALQSVVRKKTRTQSVSTLPTLSNGGQPEAAPTESIQDLTSAALATPAVPAAPAEEVQSAEPEPCTTTPLRDSEPPLPPTGEELCGRIRNQYFEALYHSKGSLAYFPKGSLSRARAAFHLDTDSTLNMTDLVDFLKSLIMTMSQINKKYQETVPSIIQEMKGHVESSDEGKSKKKRARKMKLGRNCLYPEEDQQIRTWWGSNKPELNEGDASISESQVKSFISLLRTRETQLQMILMLEVLALQPLASTDRAEDSQLPGIENSVEAEASKKTKKKQQSLADAVDMHADLLCIWQSTSSNEVRLLEDAQVTDHTREGQKAQRASAEPLRDFCVDIIMPFFHARLPEICDSLNRKLGGPLIPSPPRTRQPKPKPKVSGQQAKPGTATKRPMPSKPKSLRRALSNEQAAYARRSISRGPSKAVAALLSATETIVPGLKRENSDSVNLMAIPRRKSDYGLLRDKSINVLSRSSSFSTTNNDEVKSKKKALVDAELKEAISALRKPNRQLAGKAVMEAVERRTSGGGLSQLKKSRKPVRLGGDDAVPVVKATPFGNRYRQAELQPVRPFASLLHGSDDAPPPSSASVIPATAPRPGFRDALGPSPAVERVEATPARPTSATPKGGLLGVFPPSPAKDRVAAGSGRAPLARTRNGFLDTPTADRIAATPVRRPAASSTPAEVISATPPIRNIRDMFLTPVKPRVPLAAKIASAKDLEGEKKAVSVYERLGWDNDVDDL